MIILLIIVSIIICIVVHIFSMAAAGSLAGIEIEKISLFFGPRLKQIIIGNTIFELNLIPFGGYVKFHEFEKAHPIKQIFIAISGCIVLVIMAVLAFGFSEGIHKFIMGFSQIISGALSPRIIGSQLLLALYEFVKANSFAVVLGLVASKTAAANLFPIPSMNGGDALLILLNQTKPIPLKTQEILKQIGFVIMFIIFICWVIALYFVLKLF